MAQSEVFKRFALIFTCVNRGHFPSLREIKEFLVKNDIRVSDRSIQRDIEQLRVEFGLEIVYDRPKQGYFLNKEVGRYLDYFLRFLDAVNNAELLADCMREGKKALRFVSFDSMEDYGGTQHLNILLNAIRKRRVVTFSHESFYNAEKKVVTVRPYLLKEYQGRWYLLCNFAKGKRLYPYGLDRVREITVTTETFDSSDVTDPNKLFESSIGISHTDGEPQEIHLSVAPDQIKYLKTLPLHRSQKILSEAESETILSLKVVPNIELVQKILMLGENIKVLKPPSLVKEIKASLRETLKNYK